MTGSFYFTPLPSSGLRVKGADQLDFLQGQMTNDLRRAATPSALPAAFLNARGQIEQFAYLYRRASDVYLHLLEGQAELLAARFKRYIIFDQVEVEDVSSKLRTLHIWGGWPQWEGLPALESARAGDAWEIEPEGGPKLLFGAVQRTGELGLDLHYLAEREPEVMAYLLPLGGQAAVWEELQEARVVAGIPAPVVDGFLGTLPQEVGLDVGGPLPAISYSKGCYVGQEIMARLEARGRQRYGLQTLQLGEGSAPEAGTPVLLEGKEVGQIGRAAGGLALARLRLDLPEDAALTCGAVQVTPLPAGAAISDG